MRVLFFILMLSCFKQLQATTYYFSSASGNDSRSASEAQNPSTPWKTLGKLNAVFSSLNPGDIILFQRNEVFDGSLVISRSGSLSQPITFGAYGSGAKPVINGLSTLGNWNNTGGGIWESPINSNTMVNTVLINGTAKEIGRFPNSNTPNKGYLNFETYSGNTSITDNELSGSPNWNGGEVVIRKTRWVIDRNLISNHSGNRIDYISESPYGAEANFGYFIQNHPRTLDLDGEWYYKLNEKQLGVYLPSGNPASLKIQASTVQTLVSIINQSNIAFENLSFQGPNNHGFDLVNAQHIRISSCDILFCGVNAINAKNCNDITLENSEVNHTNNVALNMDNCSSLNIKNNKINNTGITAGMGKGDSGSYEALLISGDNVYIDHNEIENTGYIPITFRGNTNVITNNFINNFAMVKDDAAGIYTWNNIPGNPPTFGTKIISNVILNGIGAPEGTIWPGYRPASGLYMDDKTANVEITGNTAANCGLYGIYIHNAYNISLQNNTFYNNQGQVVLTSDQHSPESPVRNVNMNNNILVAKEYYNRVAEFKTFRNDIAEFGNFDNNYYLRPVDDNIVIHPSFQINGNYSELNLTLDEWKALYGKDLNSKKSPSTVSSTDQIRFEYNGTSNSNTVALYGIYVYVTNQCYSGGITLAPYTSVVLLPKSGVPQPGIECPGTGGILREQWNNVAGNEISSIPLTQTPASTSQMTSFESANIGDAYGARMRGYVCPPQSGAYTFMISGDDQVELWLSTDENPANKRKIASFLSYTNLREFTKFPSQKSQPVNLQAGTKYYIEVLHKEGDGGDHVTVAWQLPSGGTQVPIPGNRLAPYTGSPNPPTNPPATGSGLNYKYYEGNWDLLPNFNTITPVKTGTTANIDLGVRNVNDYFGLVWEGYINIPSPGNYTFETISDDGSKFYFNSFYSPNGTALVTNDGLHAQQSVTGTVNIPAAGAYPVAITFFEKTGGESMQLYWSGPGIPRQLVPDAAFKQGSGSTDGCSASGSILHELWQNIDGNDISSIPVNATPGTVNQVTSLETLNLGDSYGERMRGYICPPQNGNYTFIVAGDDAVEVWLSSDDNPANKQRIINLLSWTSYHEYNKFSSQRSAPVNLQSGRKYYIEVLHKEGGGDDHVTVGWEIPGSLQEYPIPGSRLSPYTANGNPPVTPQDCAGNGSILQERWDNVQGSTVSSIPLNSSPQSAKQLGNLETSNSGNNYGERIRGYLCPPISGNYTFMISGDDHVELWLSSDGNPANKTRIANLNDWSDFHQFNKYPSQRSSVINLQAGQRYYIEVLHKQAGGADHVTVAWQLPNGVTETPIAGSHLSPYTSGVVSNSSGTAVLQQIQGIADLEASQLQLKATPNPFRTSATIQFKPVESGDAVLEVYTIQGVLVQRIFSGKVQSGVTKTFKLSGDKLSQGVYILHLVTKTKVISRKIIFTR